MKKIILNILKIFFLLIIFLKLSIFPVSQAKILCGGIQGFALYNCRVDDICKKYNDSSKKETNLEDKDLVYNNEDSNVSDSDSNDVYRTINYLNPKTYYNNKILVKELQKEYSYSEIPIGAATKNYKENMNGIYKCAILFSKRKALDEVEKIINIDTSGALAQKTEKKLKRQIKLVVKKIIDQNRKKVNSEKNKLDKIFKGKCSKLDYKKLTRMNILKETTYETCKYRMYMEFLKQDYYKKDIKNLVKIDKKTNEKVIQGSTIGLKYNNIIKKIDAKIEHAYLVFNDAFQEYTVYESNYTLHILLGLLKDSYIVFRERLHNVLTPINQVPYKIKNAMIMQ